MIKKSVSPKTAWQPTLLQPKAAVGPRVFKQWIPTG